MRTIWTKKNTLCIASTLIINNKTPTQHCRHSTRRLPTLSEIKVKIPRQYFRSSTLKSMLYAILDILFIALAYIFMIQLETMLRYEFLLFPLYWYVQGKSYGRIESFSIRVDTVVLRKRYSIHGALLNRSRLCPR